LRSAPSPTPPLKQKPYERGECDLAKYQGGSDALDALETEKSGDIEFYSLRSGTSVKVRVMGLRDMIRFRSYGIFKVINSFVAENPSKYSDKDYPKSDFTPWDLAFNHYSDLAFEEENEKVQKELRAEGRKYLGKDRYALGFINLETGLPIIIDFSKKQAKSVHGVFKKNEKKLGTKAFEIEKSGSGTDTVVTATSLDMDDLTDKERKNFDKYDGKEFDMNLFDDILYVADEKEQVELLAQAGFDVSLIGYSAEGGEAPSETEGDSNDDLPF
jgi:hypothetical protein